MNERGWTSKLCKELSVRSRGAVYAEPLDNTTAKYAGRPDMFVSGPRCDMHVEIKLLQHSDMLRKQDQPIQESLKHKISLLQHQWLAQYVVRCGLAYSRQCGVLILVLKKTRLDGGFFLPGGATQLPIQIKNLEYHRDVYQFLLGKLL